MPFSVIIVDFRLGRASSHPSVGYMSVTVVFTRQNRPELLGTKISQCLSGSYCPAQGENPRRVFFCPLNSPPSGSWCNVIPRDAPALPFSDLHDLVYRRTRGRLAKRSAYSKRVHREMVGNPSARRCACKTAEMRGAVIVTEPLSPLPSTTGSR